MTDYQTTDRKHAAAAGPPDLLAGNVRAGRQHGESLARARHSRFAKWSVALPAGLITLGLFMAMERVISTEFTAPEAPEMRLLTLVTPSEADTQNTRSTRDKPQPLDTADIPPPAPNLFSDTADIDLPVINISGSPPAELNITGLSDLLPPPPIISDANIRPIQQPVPSYPDSAARAGLEGDCDVFFSVDRRGQPFDVTAQCTDRVFESSARRAVERVQFAPKIIRQQAVEQHGAVYPIAFRLAQ